MFACTLLLAGCALGQRPTLEAPEVPTPTGPVGDAQVDALLDRMATMSTGTFSATFSLTHDGQTTAAEVNRQPPITAVAIGSDRFYAGGNRELSCNGSSCADGIDADLVTRVGWEPTFFSDDAAADMRAAYSARTAEPSFSTRESPAGPADCVTIALAAGSDIYCVAASGMLTYADGPGGTIVLDTISEQVDAAAVALP